MPENIIRPLRSDGFSCARSVPTFCTPVSGSRVITDVAVKYGAASNPGVDIGIGSDSRPRPRPRRAAAPPPPAHRLSLQHDLMTCGRVHDAGRDRLRDGPRPCWPDVVQPVDV